MRRSVLSIAVNVIGHFVVHRDVIHLCNGQIGETPVDPAMTRDADASVVRHRHAVGIERIDPHVVVVPPGLGNLNLPRFSAVEGDHLSYALSVKLVGIVRRQGDPRIVVGPLVEHVITADEIPVFSPSSDRQITPSSVSIMA